MLNVLIQKAEATDVNSMAELLNILLSQETDFTPNIELQKRGLQLIMNNPNSGQLFVAKAGIEVIGMVNLLFTISTAIGKKVAILEDMILLPEYRNSGIGGKLIEHAKQFAINEGYGRITLLTDNDNYKAQDFYKRHGFKKSAMVAFRYVVE